jgi:hypothetical protein
MVSAFGAVHVVSDIAHGLKIACATIGAAFDTAIRCERCGKGFGEISLQPFFRDPTIEMIPWQYFVKHTPTQIKIRVSVMLSKGLLPEVETKLLRPAIKPTTKTIGREKRAS